MSTNIDNIKVTEDDERQADALCKRHLERWREELE